MQVLGKVKVWQVGMMVSARGVDVWYNPFLNVWQSRNGAVQSTGSYLLGEL